MWRGGGSQQEVRTLRRLIVVPGTCSWAPDTCHENAKSPTVAVLEEPHCRNKQECIDVVAAVAIVGEEMLLVGCWYGFCLLLAA